MTATPEYNDPGTSPHRRQDRGRSRVRPFFVVVGVPLLVVVAVILYLRSQPVDHPLTIAVVGVAPLTAIPLAMAATSAVAARSRIFQALTSVVVALYLGVIAPFDAVIGCGGSVTDAASPGRTATVLTANVLVGGADPNEFADTVSTVKPDIVVMQELRGDFLDPLRADERMADYQWRSEDFPDGRRGIVIWSRWPLSDVEHRPMGISSGVQAAVDSPLGELDVVAVHLTAPAIARNVDPWYEDLAALGARSMDRPTIIAGDFNATEDHLPFRRLVGQGWSDVHDNKGCGLDATWPSGGLPIAVMRLDHILTSGHFSTRATEILPAGGSDHHPVVATIELVE